MEVESWLIKNLRLDPNNARKHDQRNLDAIKASLDKFGQRKPIVISKEGVILAGNGTVTAAKELGWSTIDVTVAPADWDQATAKAYALADNRTAELAEWDTSVLASQLMELQDQDWDTSQLGFESSEKPTDADLEDAFGNLGAEKGEIETMSFILHNAQADTVRAAIEASKKLGDFGDTGNTNSNGNAITRIAELWLGSNVG
jgi:ParB-like chromosome segregation protein Spo0J